MRTHWSCPKCGQPLRPKERRRVLEMYRAKCPSCLAAIQRVQCTGNRGKNPKHKYLMDEGPPCPECGDPKWEKDC